MSDTFHARFSAEEIAAIRESLRDEARFGGEFMQRLKRVARRIPFAEDLLAAWFCTRDPADASCRARLFRAADRRHPRHHADPRLHR